MQIIYYIIENIIHYIEKFQFSFVNFIQYRKFKLILFNDVNLEIFKANSLNPESVKFYYYNLNFFKINYF